MKPMTDASAVPLITCTRKPTVGGTAMRSACGADDVAQLLAEAQREAARRLPLALRATASTQPRQISVRKALV